MTDLDTILKKLKELEPSLREKYGVSGFWVFGSYARGEEKESSDLDLLVEFDRPGMSLLRFVELELFLEDGFGMKVDLVQRSAIKERMRDSILGEAIAA